MSRLLAALQRHQLAREHARLVAEALLASPDAVHPRFGRSAPLDPRAMRGTPFVARGVGGAIPGSVPHVDGLHRAHRDLERRQAAREAG